MQRILGFLAIYSKLKNKRDIATKTKKYEGGNSIGPHSNREKRKKQRTRQYTARWQNRHRYRLHWKRDKKRNTICWIEAEPWLKIKDCTNRAVKSLHFCDKLQYPDKTFHHICMLILCIVSLSLKNNWFDQ